MKKILTLLFCCSTAQLMAQQAVVATGTNATGIGGSASYSIGQVAYTNLSGTNGKVNQGVQQPVEIFTLGADNFPEITLTMSVYPNPTTASVNLNIRNYEGQNLQYELFDLNGRQISQQKITQSETSISLANSANAIYLLYVWGDDKLLKTFKIIKN